MPMTDRVDKPPECQAEPDIKIQVQRLIDIVWFPGKEEERRLRMCVVWCRRGGLGSTVLIH
jgi:hypothetical protein